MLTIVLDTVYDIHVSSIWFDLRNQQHLHWTQFMSRAVSEGPGFVVGRECFGLCTGLRSCAGHCHQNVTTRPILKDEAVWLYVGVSVGLCTFAEQALGQWAQKLGKCVLRQCV